MKTLHIRAKIYIFIKDLKPFDCAAFRNSVRLEFHGFRNKTNTILIFINQLREKVGIQYGSPEVTTGGRALKFYSSVRLDIRRSDKITAGSEQIGTRAKVKVVKNKMAPPFREAEFDIMYGEGISMLGELVDLGVSFGYLEKSGSWYSAGEIRIGQGRDAAKQYLKDNPEFAGKLEADIRRSISTARQDTAASPAEEPSPAAVDELAG